jgi:hypothetical protein
MLISSSSHFVPTISISHSSSEQKGEGEKEERGSKEENEESASPIVLQMNGEEKQRESSFPCKEGLTEIERDEEEKRENE